MIAFCCRKDFLSSKFLNKDEVKNTVALNFPILNFREKRGGLKMIWLEKKQLRESISWKCGLLKKNTSFNNLSGE